MGVVAAGVHHALRLAAEGQVVRLLDGESVDVGPQRDDTSGAAAAEDPHDARLRHGGSAPRGRGRAAARPRGGPCAPRGCRARGARAGRGARPPRPARAAPRRRGSRASGRRRDRGGPRARRRGEREPAAASRASVVVEGYDTREEAPHLLRPELPPLARRQLAEVEPPDAHAHELDDLVPDRRAHPPDLAVLALGEDDLEPGRALALPDDAAGGATARGPEDPHLRRPRHRAVVERQALPQRAERLAVGNARDARVVGLRDVVLGGREALAEAVVVRQDEEPRGVAVEPADREDPAAHVAEGVVDGGPPAGVRPGRDEALRLVEGDDHPRRVVADPPAVHEDPVAGRVDPAGRPALEGAVDAHAAVGDPALGLAARRDAELGEGAGEGDGARRPQAGSGRSPRANVIWPSHTTFPSTRARPPRLPILLRRRSTSHSSRTRSPATTGRR